MDIFELVKFGLVFLGLCFTVVLGIIFTNVFVYSYKPKNAVVFIALIVVFFFISGLLAHINFATFINELKSQIGVIDTTGTG